MEVGFIGAGKVGFSLGRYFAGHNIRVSGYYSRNPQSAREAADFTGTGFYASIDDLIRDSKVIFITTPDDVIGQIWEQLKAANIYDRIVCHCSGVLSSEIFSDISAPRYRCRGYSIHPLLAVSSRLHSYKELSNTLFTIESSTKDCAGSPLQEQSDSQTDEMDAMLHSCGNQVIHLRSGDKAKYHAAAVMASNLVLGLAQTAAQELQSCGFSREDALGALVPFMQMNVAHLENHTPEEALTGPVERGDVQTVYTHLGKLTAQNREIYRLLSGKVLDLAKKKNPARDYHEMDQILKCKEDL
ncbi:MAG: DUF2520 domain-containing protein [Lachnospiraceae bacterium]|nr:DUF2520 domain-containing protein [Lachnospiraceae bacterium]